MSERILIIDGHPDGRPERFLHALAAAYAESARAEGHQTRVFDVARTKFELLRTTEEFEKGVPPAAIMAAQKDLLWSTHVVILFPLWLGAMPALLKGFLEQLLRPGFAFAPVQGRFPRKLLAGRTVHVIVTMGMPGVFYRWYYRAHSLKSLERNVLAFCGLECVGSTVIGRVGDMSASRRGKWIERIRRLGRRAR